MIANGKWLAVLAATCALAGLAGCAGPGGAVDSGLIFTATGVGFLEDAGAPSGGAVGQGDTVIQETGQGLPAAGAEDPLIRRLTALQAARQVALARLAAKVEGVEVHEQSQVRNLEFAGQLVESNVTAHLAGVRVVDSAYDESTGLAEVTVVIGLDEAGALAHEFPVSAAPASPAARRARAEAAARVDALARLREEIGEVEVGQEVTVRDLRFSDHRAWLTVDGVLEGAEFGEPVWPEPGKCTVEATVRLTLAQLAALRELTRPAP